MWKVQIADLFNVNLLLLKAPHDKTYVMMASAKIHVFCVKHEGNWYV